MASVSMGPCTHYQIVESYPQSDPGDREPSIQAAFIIGSSSRDIFNPGDGIRPNPSQATMLMLAALQSHKLGGS